MSVRLGLLALLDSEDMYGYQLKTAYESWTGEAWVLNVGQVYSTLDRLERDGLVSVVGAGPRAGDASGAPPSDDPSGRSHTYYAITHAGRETLAEWFEATPAEAELPRDELVAKILLAMAGGRARAVEVVARQRTALTTALQVRRLARRGAPRANGHSDQLSSLSPFLVDDAVVARTEAELRWLDQCEARLLRTANDEEAGGRR